MLHGAGFACPSRMPISARNAKCAKSRSACGWRNVMASKDWSQMNQGEQAAAKEAMKAAMKAKAKLEKQFLSPNDYFMNWINSLGHSAPLLSHLKTNPISADKKRRRILNNASLWSKSYRSYTYQLILEKDIGNEGKTPHPAPEPYGPDQGWWDGTTYHPPQWHQQSHQKKTLVLPGSYLHPSTSSPSPSELLDLLEPDTPSETPPQTDEEH
jgi:hypothetical protein